MRPRSRPRSVPRLAATLALGCLAATGMSGLGPLGTGLATTGATYTSSQDAGASWFSTRAACSAGTSYPAAVTALNPTLYYRFGEGAAPAPASVADSSGAGNDGTVVAGGPTTSEVFGATSDIWCDSTAAMRQPAVASSVGAAGTVVWNNFHAAPDVFTLMAWVQVPAGLTTGGRVLGFSSAASGESTDHDRILFLDNAGHAVFGIHPGAVQVISSPGVVNDGRPHQLVASLGPAGGRLYVDGSLVASDPAWTVGQAFNGYWRIGWDTVDSWLPGSDPTDFGLDATIDEVAVFEGTQLGSASVAGTYAANHW
jgi:Concanavalin A-like lectin/glucanases superfamily